MNKITGKQIAVLGVFAALAYVLMFFSRFLPPLIPGLPFLKYDPKDIIIAIAGFLFGPLPALALTVVVSLIEMITVGSTGFIGLLMNVLSTSAFVIPAAVIYSKKRSIIGALIGLAVGLLLMTGVMLLWNYLITPIYMGYPRDAVAKLLLPGFLPFNLIKGILNAGFTLLLYKPIVTALRKTGLMPPSTGSGKRNPIGIILLAVLLLATATLLILIFNKII